MAEFNSNENPCSIAAREHDPLVEDVLVRIYDHSNDDYFSETPFRSTAYGMVLVTKGSLKIKINFVEHQFQYRDIICVLPGNVYEIPKQMRHSVICLFFHKEYLMRRGIFLNIAEAFHLSPGEGSFRFGLSRNEYTDIRRDMIALHNRMGYPDETPHIKDIIHNSFLSVIYDVFLVIEDRVTFPTRVIDSAAELTHRFITLVSDRFRIEKRVAYYANCLRITPRHLSQVVKQTTGKTAGEVIDDFVIREAKLLLVRHVMNISEIADSLKFNDSSFFGKFFKKHTGVSPLAFKQTHHVAI